MSSTNSLFDKGTSDHTSSTRTSESDSLGCDSSKGCCTIL